MSLPGTMMVVAGDSVDAPYLFTTTKETETFRQTNFRRLSNCAGSTYMHMCAYMYVSIHIHMRIGMCANTNVCPHDMWQVYWCVL